MSPPRSAKAFVPGHVTGLFTVHRVVEPARSGSRGAGVTLTDGVTVELAPDQDRQVLVDDRATTVAPVERVLDALDISGTVRIQTDLPLGNGFGLSGGMALGTALAANEAFGLAKSENELTRLAHVAEVQAGTGLGDVVAQARGGMPLRLEPGAPPHGELDGIPATGRVEYLPLGGLSTPDILAERPGIITDAGTEALETLSARPTPGQFMDASRAFAEDVGLLTAALADILGSVRDSGGTASMAMLGESAFALGTDLSDAGFDPAVSAIDRTGATLID